MLNTRIIFPHILEFGSGLLSKLPEEIQKQNAKRVALLTIKPLLGTLAPVVESLHSNGIETIIDTSLELEPTFADLNRVMAVVSPFQPDLILGIGGGTVLDVAKLVSALLNHDQSLSDIVGIGMLTSRNTKLICMPATSGTGSEVSPNAILVDDADGQKKGIISPYLLPDVVLVDPALTCSVPPSITAATGLDAFVHCMEAYTNKFSTPFIDMFAKEGMKLIAENLLTTIQNGSDLAAREKVALGSLYGGFCLGPVNTAAIHALAYPLGTAFHLAHGLSNALMMPYVMEFNLKADLKKYADVARILGVTDSGTDEEIAQAGIAKVKEWVAACGIPTRLRDLNIPEESITTLAADALKVQRLLKNNPRPVLLEDAIEIYKSAF